MATRRNPRFKECRALGVNVCGHPKALERVVQVSRSKKKSNYALQLIEKQKVKAYYGIFERQLRNYFDKANRRRDLTPGEALLTTLECRLDNMVYRMGFANSIRFARQMVTHRHILVNGKILNIPSCQLKPGDVVTLKKSSRQAENLKRHFTLSQTGSYPYIEKESEKFQAKLTRVPQREELPIEINDQLVVEYYSH